jgi:hypothetical protein
MSSYGTRRTYIDYSQARNPCSGEWARAEDLGVGELLDVRRTTFGYGAMSAESANDDVPTLVAVGAIVAICASLAHHALGHGVGCLFDRGTVTLITFMVFRCEGAGVLTDGGGPVGAFVVASLCLITLRQRRPKPSVASLFAYALGVQMMLWVCAQMVRQGIDGSDDWGHVARGLGWPPEWHTAAIAIGLIGYGVTIRIAATLGTPLARGRPARLLIPYASACLFAVVFGALWHGDRAASALDGFLSFGVASLGYVLAIRVVARARTTSDTPAIGRSSVWLAVAGVVGCVFALTIAQGVGGLA